MLPSNSLTLNEQLLDFTFTCSAYWWKNVYFMSFFFEGQIIKTPVLGTRQYLHSLHQERASYFPWTPIVRWRGWSPVFGRLSVPMWTQHSSKRRKDRAGWDSVRERGSDRTGGGDVCRGGQHRSKDRRKKKGEVRSPSQEGLETRFTWRNHTCLKWSEV